MLKVIGQTVVDVLVHECTMENKTFENAMTFGHSTAGKEVRHLQIKYILNLKSGSIQNSETPVLDILFCKFCILLLFLIGVKLSFKQLQTNYFVLKNEKIIWCLMIEYV